MIALIVIGVLTGLLAVVTILSFLPISHGFYRVFSFPRVQFCVAAIVLFLASLVFLDRPRWEWALLSTQIACLVAQGWAIAQFLPVRPSQSDVYEGPPDQPNMVSVLSYNVKMSNVRFQEAIDLVRLREPDIAIFMETDEKWDDALSVLVDRWPNHVREPLDNSYGMLLYSRLKLEDTTVQHLVMKDTPSIVTTAILPNGKPFRLYCVHPEPPVPYADSVGRDAELVRVARQVTKEKLPTIVCGDLNDVAWSHTTRLFQRMSRLLDPRVGRGFFNTFDARYWFMRWPLDHLFHDARFALVSMQRMPHIGSDHFPILFQLALTDGIGTSKHPQEQDEDDRTEAAEISDDAKDLDRRAIGVDWEK